MENLRVTSAVRIYETDLKEMYLPLVVPQIYDYFL